MESKLNLNRNLVDKARESARRIAEDTQNFIDLHTTVTVERAVCRLLGIDGVNALEVPLPNVVVDHLFDGRRSLLYRQRNGRNRHESAANCGEHRPRRA